MVRVVCEAADRTLAEGERDYWGSRWQGERGRRLSRDCVSMRFVLIFVYLSPFIEKKRFLPFLHNEVSEKDVVSLWYRLWDKLLLKKVYLRTKRRLRARVCNSLQRVFPSQLWSPRASGSSRLDWDSVQLKMCKTEHVPEYYKNWSLIDIVFSSLHQTKSDEKIIQIYQ